MSAIGAQVGMKTESVVGTAVTVDHFQEVVNESIIGRYERVESSSLRSAARMQRSDRWAPNPKGAGGNYTFEVMSKGFAFWLVHMLGTVTTTGPTDTTAYTHTGKMGSLTGDSFTFQVGRDDTTGTVNPFTYNGGKVVSWELSNSVDGNLMCSMELDFWGETTATGLATASYPTSMEIFNFTTGLVTIGGVATDVTDVSIRLNNNLSTGRFFVKNSTTKKEQVEAPQREGSVSLGLEFDSLTQYNRVKSATTAAAMGDVIAVWTGVTLAGAATAFNKVTATLNTVRFDSLGPAIQGPDIITSTLEGKILDESDALTPVNIAVVSNETTP